MEHYRVSTPPFLSNTTPHTMARIIVLIVAFMALIAGVFAAEEKLAKLQIGELDGMDQTVLL